MTPTDKPQHTQESTDSSLPTAMDIYEYLWKGRDFELEHLWQRSIFLAAFLFAVAALYTGYMKEFFIPKYTAVETQTEYSSGNFSLCADMLLLFKNRYIVSEQYPKEITGTYTVNKTLTQNKKDQTDTLVLHDITLFGLIPIAITLLGLVFSVLWITMAKGSKAWYELYESNIAAISGNKAFWEGVEHTNQELTNRFGKKQDSYKAYLFGNLENQNDDPIDSRLFSVNAGPFSVSKVNTMIGIISLAAFLCVFIFHVYWTVKLFNMKDAHYGFFTLVCFTAELLTAFFIIFRLKTRVRSSYFDNL